MFCVCVLYLCYLWFLVSVLLCFMCLSYFFYFFWFVLFFVFVCVFVIFVFFCLTKWEISTKFTDESQAEESNPDNQEAEMVVRDTLMIASMKNLIEEALNDQNIKITNLIAEAVKEAVIPLQLEIVDLKDKLKKREFQ